MTMNNDLSSLPAPPLPEDLDLSSLEYMPLVIGKLRRSKAWLKAKRRPELGFYMMNLWTTAWMERPAASLDDDDDVLADAAMCSPEKWGEVREFAMHGFYKCSNGRLYHPFLVEQAEKALDKRLKWREKKKGQRSENTTVHTIVPEVSEGTSDGHGNKIRLVPGDIANVRGDSAGTSPKFSGDIPLRDGTGRDGKVIEDPPSPPGEFEPKTEGRASGFSDEAQECVADFERLLDEAFPNGSAIPTSRLTLWHQAETWLAAGMDVESMRDAVFEGMRWYATNKRPAPKDFSAFKKSLTEIAAKRKGLRDIDQMDGGHRDAASWPHWAQAYRDMDGFWNEPTRGTFPGTMPADWSDYATRKTDARPDGKSGDTKTGRAA